MCLKLQLCAGSRSVRMRLNCMQNKIVFYKHKIITAKFLSIKPKQKMINMLSYKMLLSLTVCGDSFLTSALMYLL